MKLKSEMTALDVYTWKFKNEDEYLDKHRHSGTAYWCLDKQLVIDKNGDFRDTYKAYSSDWELKEGCFQSCRILNKDAVEIVDYICNLNDVEFIHMYSKDDYDVVYDLSYHHNLKKLYAVDKGAKVSNSKILENKKKDLSRKMAEIKYLLNDVGLLKKDISELEQI